MLHSSRASLPQHHWMSNAFILVNVNPEKNKGKLSFQEKKMTKKKLQ